MSLAFEIPSPISSTADFITLKRPFSFILLFSLSFNLLLFLSELFIPFCDSLKLLFEIFSEVFIINMSFILGIKLSI